LGVKLVSVTSTLEIFLAESAAGKTPTARVVMNYSLNVTATSFSK